MARLNNSDGCRPLQSIVLSCEQVLGTLQPSEFVNTCPNRRAGYQSGCQHLEFMSGAQAPYARVPFADGNSLPRPRYRPPIFFPAFSLSLMFSGLVGSRRMQRM